jgi:hypothetical protein
LAHTRVACNFGVKIWLGQDGGNLHVAVAS